MTDQDKNELFAASLVLIYAGTGADIESAYQNAVAGEYHPDLIEEPTMRNRNWGHEKLEHVMMLWRTVYL